jgi:predicted porin
MSVGDKNGKLNTNGLASYVKEQFANLRDELKTGFKDRFDEITLKKENESKPGFSVPEYWNSENTSQRIFEFSISFSAQFNGSDQEYLSKVKSAIEKGFNQAKQVMGKLPDAITDLTDETYKLVMEKLESWISERDSEDLETV